MKTIDKILNDMKKIKNVDLDKKYTFRLSIGYFIYSFVIILILAFNIYLVIRPGFKVSMVAKIVIFAVFIFLIYYVKTILKYKIVINNRKFIQDKLELDIEKVESIVLKIDFITRRKRELCLQLISEQKRYLIRLNIQNRALLIYLISKISNKEVVVDA